ncbi:helix-turn-helix domain-containing protein [Paractinoplanes globisporus]|uniref:Helix-turn-helix domain-containing protein n=1 Tax=Paractinoplanes globisporus TaxID=113565 RepID=A0ABW6WU37_9ACTN|nr:XRE family transcriptional regulator [Actinoplanes globisporus]
MPHTHYIGSDVAATLAANLRAARLVRGWTLEELAEHSSVSRNMLQQIETARTNPSVGTLARIAATLAVPIGDLVSPPPGLVDVVRRGEATVRRTAGGSEARLLINDGHAPFVELWDFAVAAGDEIRSDGHPTGARELLLLHSGELTVEVGGTQVGLGPGDGLRMRGDRSHTYANPGLETAHLSITVVYPGDRDRRYLPPD